MADLDAVLDAALAGVGEPAPAADPPAPAPAPEPAAPAPAVDLQKSNISAPPAADPDPFDTGADTFDRGYVEKLRNEAAERRVRAKELEDRYGSAFDGVGDDEAAVWLDVVKTWKQDPTAVAEWMREQAEAILAGEQPPAPPAGADQPLTRAEVEQLLSQRDTQQQQRQAVAAVNKEVADLGLDPNSRGGKELMLRALEDHGGDIGAAHKAMQTELATFAQKAVDDYLAKKAEGAGGPAPVTSTGGAAPAVPKISNIKDAARAADAYFASQGFK